MCSVGSLITLRRFLAVTPISHRLCFTPAFQIRPALFETNFSNPTTFFKAKTFAKMTDNKEDLKKKLTPLQYHVTQEKGTERPHTGEYDKFFEEGMYSCVVCGQELFSSKTKFDSGCGWPAFNDVLDQGLVKLSTDTSLAPRIRTEVQCAKCDAHLGHVFDDGP
uniref:Peptide-methionine (R)-S-oxide reductase n=2 Tax=Lygus hesperus TaxID=30085 RepID=A0A0K8TC60_LYGHE